MMTNEATPVSNSCQDEVFTKSGKGWVGSVQVVRNTSLLLVPFTALPANLFVVFFSVFYSMLSHLPQ